MKTTQSLTVSADILKSTGLNLEELSRHLSKLKSFLGTRIERVMPSHINDVLTLNWVVNLSQCLEKLSHCKGFDIHISRYSGKNDIRSAYDVAVLAAYLLDKVDSIELEPLIKGEKHRQDILVSHKGERVSLECKTIDTKKFDCRKEHGRMFSILAHYIDVPHQIDVKYKASLLETETHELGKAIKERLGPVTADGCIIHNEKIEVGVQRRETSYKGPIRMILTGISEDIRDQCFYPMCVYMADGKTLSLSGPKVDYTCVLRGKLAKGRKQSPSTHAYILVVNCNNMLGGWSDNIRAVSSAFQPKRNTRFSAVLLVRYHQPVGSRDVKFEFELIGNPFAKIPVGKEFKGLFKATSA